MVDAIAAATERFYWMLQRGAGALAAGRRGSVGTARNAQVLRRVMPPAVWREQA